MTLQAFIRAGLMAAILSGAFGVLDALVFDVVAEGSIPAKVAGLASIAFGMLGVTGLYLCEQRRRPCRHLDAGYLLNMVGLAAVSGLAFARNFVLDELDDATLDALKEAGPTVPALMVTGALGGIGFVAFGSALIRHRFDAVGSWGYTLLLPLSGFAAQLPVGAAAALQGLAALAIVRLGIIGLRHLAAVPATDPARLPAPGSSTPARR